jgi:hypothetical protein
MTLEIRFVIKRHDSMRSGTDAFSSSKRQVAVAGMMKCASAVFV